MSLSWTFAACALAVSATDSAWDGRRRVVHEWGTFTAVQGSNGQRLDGLVHESRDLPEFVYDATRTGVLSGASPKMETPVIYFYSPSMWTLALRVDFPRGRITHWYPRATQVNGVGRERLLPDSLTAIASGEISKGSIAWGEQCELTVLDPGESRVFPAVSADDPWRHAREVRANALEVRHLTAPAGSASMLEAERFLFYRGLGDFELPLVAHVAWEQRDDAATRVSLRFENKRPPDEPLTRLILISVGANDAGYRELPDVTDALDLGPVEIRSQPIDAATDELTELVAARLVTTGLYTDEAHAMARTWASSWFRDPGLRLLYLLPRALVDRELPLAIVTYASQPEDGASAGEIVRTFVARAELLSPEREQELVSVAMDLAHGSRRAAEEVDRWGRLAVPYLRRARELISEPGVRALIDRQVLERSARGR